MANINRLRNEIEQELGSCELTDKQLEEIVEEESNLIGIHKKLDSLVQTTEERKQNVFLPLGRVEIPIDKALRESTEVLSQSNDELRRAFVRVVGELKAEMSKVYQERAELIDTCKTLLKQLESEMAESRKGRIDLARVCKSLDEVAKAGPPIVKAADPAPIHVHVPKILKTVHQRDEEGNITSTDYIYE